MKIAIVGSRTFQNYDLLVDKLLPFHLAGLFDMIISGGARGADLLGEKYATYYEIETAIFKPDWDIDGKVAGFIRNQRIVDACDMVIAFWDGKSSGTQDTIEKAKIARKPTYIIFC